MGTEVGKSKVNVEQKVNVKVEVGQWCRVGTEFAESSNISRRVKKYVGSNISRRVKKYVEQ